MVDRPPGEQRSDDLQRLGEHLVPLRHMRPATDDMLVEVLPGAETEDEPTVRRQRDRGRLLRDDRRVIALDRAGDERHQADAVGCVGGRAEDGPGVRRMSLRVEPRVVVVGGDGEVEAGTFGPDRVVDELSGAALLAHQGVPKAGHEAALSPLEIH